MAYQKIQVKISDNQKNKIQKAINDKTDVTIRIDPNEQGNDVIALTNTQINKLSKGKPANIKLSKTQLKHNMTIEGGFLPLLAGLAARALPTLTESVLPTVAKSLGIGALTGLASTGISKLISGDGLYLKKGGCMCKIETDGEGLYLAPYRGKGFDFVGDGLYLAKGGEVYNGGGILSDVVKHVPFLNLII